MAGISQAPTCSHQTGRTEASGPLGAVGSRRPLRPSGENEADDSPHAWTRACSLRCAAVGLRDSFCGARREAQDGSEGVGAPHAEGCARRFLLTPRPGHPVRRCSAARRPCGNEAGAGPASGPASVPSPHGGGCRSPQQAESGSGARQDTRVTRARTWSRTWTRWSCTCPPPCAARPPPSAAPCSPSPGRPPGR